MKRLLGIVAGVCFATSAWAQVYNMSIVGFANYGFAVGNNLFCNPFDGNVNTLSYMLNPASVPIGTTVSLWNTSAGAYTTTATNTGSAWTVDLTLNPGTGALLVAPAAFINTFVGTVDGHDGTPFTTSLETISLPIFNGGAGTYLLGDKMPIVDTGSDIFLNLIGRLPNAGERVTTDAGTSTYLGDGNWDVVPVLNVGHAAFLEIVGMGSGTVASVSVVPEPSTLVLGGVGMSLLLAVRRKSLFAGRF